MELKYPKLTGKKIDCHTVPLAEEFWQMKKLKNIQEKVVILQPLPRYMVSQTILRHMVNKRINYIFMERLRVTHSSTSFSTMMSIFINKR